MSGFVCIDANIAVKWILPEDDSELAVGLYRKSRRESTTVIAPPFMPVEVTNVIRRYVVSKLITRSEAHTLLATFLGFSVSLSMPDGLYEEALKLAERFDRPTVYDAHYVALAQIAECELWTADQRLVNALNGRLPFVKALSSYVEG